MEFKNVDMIQHLFIINIIYFINRLKEKNRDYLDTIKILDKLQQLYMIKTLSKLGICDN